MTVVKLYTPEGIVDGVLAYPNGIIGKNLVGREFVSDWIDGKGRKISFENMPAKKARRLVKPGSFDRYAWMISSVLQNGCILPVRY